VTPPHGTVARSEQGSPAIKPQSQGSLPGQRATTIGPRHARLREATRALHGSLEAWLGTFGHFDSLKGYARYLGAVAPLYDALERKLDGADASLLLPDWPGRRKAGLIQADLDALGVAAGPEMLRARSSTVGTIPALPWHRGTVLATLYVLEGATLGGAVLARQVQRLGLTWERGAAFLDPYGADRGGMWRTFLCALEGATLSFEEETELGPRAAEVFGLFADRLGAPSAEACPQPDPQRS
jgi:heme oxygenase